MKNIPSALALMFCVSGAVCALAAEEIKTDSTIINQENLGYDVVDGKTNKIARIYAVTPVYVQVIYEGSHGARKIPRQELPPELQTKYPYDAEKAAAYEKQQIEMAARQAAARSIALRQSIRAREQEIMTEIEQLTSQDAQLQKEVHLYNTMPPGNGRKVHLSHLFDDQQGLRERVMQLRNQLVTLRASRDALP